MEKEEITILVFTVACLFSTFGLLFILTYLLYKRKQGVHAQKIQHLKEEMLQSQIEIQEQAFANISRELHDNVGQQLTLAKLHLNSLRHLPEQQDREKIEDTKDLISDTIYQIRSISKILLGEKVNSLGLIAAIKSEVERINKIGMCEVTFFTEGEQAPVNPQKEIILFRIMQEAMNNTLKHAAATTIDIRIIFNHHLHISLQDNGKGFLPQAAMAEGVGLMNMKSRASSIGATLHIQSAPEKGTLITLHLDSPN